MPQPLRNDQLASQLVSVYREAHGRLVAEYLAIVDEPSRARQAARLRQLIATNEAITRNLLDASRTWITTALPELHAAGAAYAAEVIGTSFIWTAPHREAVEQMAARLWDDVATRLRAMSAETRGVLRDQLRDATRAALLENRTATQAGVDLARRLASDGLFSVEYANGARHSVLDWADSAVRTTTAEAYNVGTLTQSRGDGIMYVEYFDGPTCCVGPGHNVGPIANGLVVHLDEVEYLSHPRCVMPGQRVLPYGGVTEVRRAWFSGPRREVTVELGSGRHDLAVGPHHPVLTREGWKAGDEIAEGDYLVHDEWADRARERGLEADLEQMPVVEDLFAAVAAVGTHALVPAASDDLHGDAEFCQGEVDVVRPAGGLLVVGDPANVQHPGERDLVGADEAVDVRQGAGMSDPLAEGVRASTDGTVSGVEHRLACLRGGGGPAMGHGLAPVAPEPVQPCRSADRHVGPPDLGRHLNARQAEGVELADASHLPRTAVHRAETGASGVASLDGPDLAAALTGDVDLAHARSVAACLGAELAGTGDREATPAVGTGSEGSGHRFTLARVVDVRVVHYEGWVYDMSTGAGFFACSNLIARNCRRSLGPRPDIVSPGQALEAEPTQGVDAVNPRVRGNEPPTQPPTTRRTPREPRTPKKPRTASQPVDA